MMMGQYLSPTAEQAAQAQRAGAQRIAGPLVMAARFDDARGRIVLELDRQCSIAFDPAVYPYLAQASSAELEEIEILAAGKAINFPQIDISLSLAALIADLLAPSDVQAQPPQLIVP